MLSFQNEPTINNFVYNRNLIWEIYENEPMQSSQDTNGKWKTDLAAWKAKDDARYDLTSQPNVIWEGDTTWPWHLLSSPPHPLVSYEFGTQSKNFGLSPVLSSKNLT